MRLNQFVEQVLLLALRLADVLNGALKNVENRLNAVQGAKVVGVRRCRVIAVLLIEFVLIVAHINAKIK